MGHTGHYGGSAKSSEDAEQIIDGLLRNRVTDILRDAHYV